MGTGGGGPMGAGMMRGGEKARNFKGTMKKLIKYLSVYKISIIIVIIFAAASAIFSIVGPKILGKATTKLFEGIMGKISDTSTGIDFNYIGGIMLTLLGLIPVKCIVQLYTRLCNVWCFYEGKLWLQKGYF